MTGTDTDPPDAAPTGTIRHRRQYIGICEPSGGAFIDATRFVVASDESNVLRIYDVTSPAIVASVSLVDILGHDKSDLEDAALGADIIYWTASQSLSSSGKDKKRKVVFATRIVVQDGVKTLAPPVVVREDFRPELLRLSGSTDDKINIEGLAIAPGDGLFFGFRNLVAGKAAVVMLKDASAALGSHAHVGEFSLVALLDLGGRGIRSLERIGTRYLVIAGRPDDGVKVGYALFWWNGVAGHVPEPWSHQPDFNDFDPEVAMLMPGGKAVMILSDDGDRYPKADLEDPTSDQRGFQSMVVDL